MKIPVSARLLCSVTALTLAGPALAQQTVGDYELPTEPASPRSRAQGPVVEGIPAPRVAAPSPTPASAPPPEIQADPDIGQNAEPDPLAAIDEMARERAPARPAMAPPVSGVEPAAAAAPSGTEATTAAAAAPTATLARPPVTTQAPGAVSAAATRSSGQPSGGLSWWMWLLALVGVGALGAAAGWLWRGRRAEAPLLLPQIERPKVTAPPAEPVSPPAELPKVARSASAAPAPVPALPDDELEDAPESPLRIALEPARLSVSLLNATLAYRILLTNGGETLLRDISIDGDMISAHASLSQDEQLAAPNSKLENRHLIRTLAPGETKVVSGEFALPLPLIRPIRNGEATLFIPLARLRIVASGETAEVLVQTSVVGQRSLRPGGGLRPFRLDLGPRIYSELAQRAFA